MLFAHHRRFRRDEGSRLFDLTGQPMSGWVLVAPAGYADDRALAEWVAEALEYVCTLSPAG